MSRNWIGLQGIVICLRVLITVLFFQYATQRAVHQEMNSDAVAGNMTSYDLSASYLFTQLSWVSGDCEPDSQLRKLICVISDSTRSLMRQLSDVDCNMLSKPQQKPCSDDLHAQNYCRPGWFIGEWSTCQSSGWQSRDVICQCQQQVTEAGRYHGIQSAACQTAPATRLRSCVQPLPHWKTGQWSECNGSCREGSQIRDVWCAEAISFKNDSMEEGMHFKIVPNSECVSYLKPAGRQHCYPRHCYDALWVTSEWNECANSCENSFESRTVLCVADDGRVLPNGPCDTANRPASRRGCRRRPEVSCSAGPQWYSSEWSSCSTKCGSGVQTRNVVCTARIEHSDNSVLQILPDSDCDINLKLPGEQNCSGRDCSGTFGVWLTGPYGKCSVSCGGGERSRKLWCLVHDKPVELDRCDHRLVPLEVEDCHIHDCHDSLPSECWNSKFGCCEDGMTPADGPNRSGCLQEDVIPFGICIDSEFGCCPDQITPALGPSDEGCSETHCRLSPFGCCPDGIRPAAGLGGIGCDAYVEALCTVSLYGCCPDGLTPANGPDMTGCDDTQSTITLETCVNCPRASVEREQEPKEGASDVKEIELAHGSNFKLTSTVTEQYDTTIIDAGHSITVDSFRGETAVSKPEAVTQALSVDNLKFDVPHEELLEPSTSVLPLISTDFSSSPSNSASDNGSTGYLSRTGLLQHESTLQDVTISSTDPSVSDTRRSDITKETTIKLEQSGDSSFVSSAVKNSLNDGFSTETNINNPTSTASDSLITKEQYSVSSAVSKRILMDIVTVSLSSAIDNVVPLSTTVSSSENSNESDTISYRSSPDVSELDFVVEQHPLDITDRPTFHTTDTSGAIVTPDSIAAVVTQSAVTMSANPDFITVTSSSTVQHSPCSNSLYGCCQDNKTPATGPRFSGCRKASSYQLLPPVPEICEDDLDVGVDCSGHSVQEDSLGPQNSFVAWYYDVNTDRCVTFNYTGCGGNRNRFNSESDCDNACTKISPTVLTSLDICSQPVDPGPCQVSVSKWYYDMERGRCLQFTFGGCLGNDNRFESRQLCESVCPTTDICSLPAEVGHCTDFHTLWYHDVDTGQCETFVYNGCRGNANRFLSRQNCENACNESRIITDTQCHLPSNPGECQNYTDLFYYNSSVSQCVKFRWGGCGGNANRFTTYEECQQQCSDRLITFQPKFIGINDGICSLKTDPGPCKDYQPMWYFEPFTQVCRRFLYGGCEGNLNKFTTHDECVEFCLTSSSAHITEQSSSSKDDTELTVARPDVTCTLEKEVGLCIAYQIRWYFDQADSRCVQFHYGGCHGNSNNFNTSEECESVCRDYLLHVTEPISLRRDACALPKDSGPCFSDDLHYYWDSELQECRPFLYGGCPGNDNNFATQDDCFATCATVMALSNITIESNESTTPAVALDKQQRRRYRAGDCYEPSEPGSCADGLQRWYFESQLGQCLPFLYTGCGGNGNNFHDQEDCDALCSKVTEICGVFQCGFQCDFGYERNLDGCYLCECYNPCKNFVCADDMICHVDNTTCGQPPCKARPVCQISSLKPGECPTSSSVADDYEVVHCTSKCKHDGDCNGTEKCCSSSTCGPVCVEPKPECESSVLGCCPDGVTEAHDWNFRGCPEEAASIAEYPRVIAVVLGRNISIRCKARGSPRPQIDWYKNGHAVISNNHYTNADSRMTLSVDGSMLKFTNVSKLDASSYSCRAYNNVGPAAIRTFTLVVQVPAEITEISPTHQTVLEGTNVSISCTAAGDPWPDIYWYKNNRSVYEPSSATNLIPAQDVSGILVTAESEQNETLRTTDGLAEENNIKMENEDDRFLVEYGLLSIRSVRKADEGDYECEAASKIGASPRKTATIKVLGKIFVNLTTSVESAEFLVNKPLMLWCNISGTDVDVDPPRVSWTKDGLTLPIKVKDMKAMIMSQDNIAVRLSIERLSLNDSGLYSCLAVREYTNNGGASDVANNITQIVTSTINISVTNPPVPHGCTDKPWLANCQLMVQAKMCRHPYYGVFCCNSCYVAEQLP